MPQKLLVGTTKGLVVLKKINQHWQIKQTHFLGMPVSIIYVNELTNTWWAGITHHHWGQKLHYSIDEGESWQAVAPPSYPRKNYPNRLWIGTEPGGLFVSEDNGQHFKLVKALWNHPSRMNQLQWFGTGRSQPFIHSIVVRPDNNDHLYIAVSCAGIFETLNSGKDWHPRNKGLVAAYLPNPNAEIGHDPHRLFACATNPDILWQQNHCGIFRSTDGAKTWKDISDKTGIANYGFALAIDHQDEEKAWVIPAVSDELRIAPNQALSVCLTENGGQTWQTLTDGLPQENCFDIVFRHALTIDKNTLAFGTTTGNLYLSENQGKSWTCLSNNLARIDCLSFV